MIASDMGRSGATQFVNDVLDRGHRVIAADIFSTGEQATSFPFEMLFATVGERPLGLRVTQFVASATWSCTHHCHQSVHLSVTGRTMSIVAIIAAALQPRLFASVMIGGLIDSLGRLIEWPLTYGQGPSLFCFGLLREFDIAYLVALTASVPLHDASRGVLK